MEQHFESASATKKEWNAPELKKADVEEITASGPDINADGHGPGMEGVS